jgi:hypothetical protein
MSTQRIKGVLVMAQIAINPVSKFSLKHRLLLHSHDSLIPVYCFTVPVMFVKLVISYKHKTPRAGHLTTRKTITRISAQCFWPSLTKDVVSFISNCRDFVQQKGPRFPMPNVTAGSITINANHSNDKIAWNIQGPFHLTTRTNKYILVILDAFCGLLSLSQFWTPQPLQ